MAKQNKFEYSVELVAFHITQVCSHKCPMCYSSNDGKKQYHFPLKVLLKVVDSLAEAKVKYLSLLGGDPATHPNVIDIAKYAVKCGMEVSILSNTLSFRNSTKEVAKYISAFEGTIHHYIPSYHDNFCKKQGAYKKLITNLKDFSNLGRKVGIAINITPATSDYIFDISNSIINREGVPIDYIVIQRIIPFGRAANCSDFTLTRGQVEIALKGIKRVKNELGVEIIIEDPVPLCILPIDLKEFVIPCQWGLTKASINGLGDLSRCGADPRYRLGNVLDKPLLEIWNESEYLHSFREKMYLPGRCKVCDHINKCGGGCPLSCEIEKDHGLDYLYKEYEKIDEKIHGRLKFENARVDELSSILQIEWGNFGGYGHIFSVNSLKRWYSHNPKMFWVVRDSRNWILGYAVIVPIRKALFNMIMAGKYSAISDFPEKDVLKNDSTEYYHLEVLSTIPAKLSSRAGTFLIKAVGQSLLKRAKYISASPISPIGVGLCKYFNFEHVSDELWQGKSYPVYMLNVNAEEFSAKLKRF